MKYFSVLLFLGIVACSYRYYYVLDFPHFTPDREEAFLKTCQEATRSSRDECVVLMQNWGQFMGR